MKQRFGLDFGAARTFLAAYAFRYYPHEFIEGGVTPLDREQILAAIGLTQQADTLYDLPTIASEQLQQFQTHLQAYTISFKRWLELNKLRTAHPFIIRYRQLRQLREEAEREGRFYTRELKQLVDMSYLTLISMINAIGGEAALEQIDRLQIVPPDSDFRAKFTADSMETFWAGFRERLPSYEPIIPLLVDFVHRHTALIPHNVQRFEQLTEIIDIEFIRQKIETQVVTLDELKGYMRFILGKAVEVGVPADEATTVARFTAIIDAQTEPLATIQQFFTELFQYYDHLTALTVTARAQARELFPEAFNTQSK